jgi:hypothetical protein
VHTQGRFVDYAKKLIEVATEIGAYISTLTDYDSVGIKIIEAANSREGMNIVHCRIIIIKQQDDEAHIHLI